MSDEELQKQQQDLRAKIAQRTGEVKETVQRFNENRRMRNRARQLRTEAPAGFVPLRDAAFPYEDVYEPYKILTNLEEGPRRVHGELIFQKAMNYLRLLAARSLFPRGHIAEQIIVLLNTRGEISSVQLVPAYLSKFRQPLNQIKELAQFLSLQLTFPSGDDSLQFYFPAGTNSVSEIKTIEDVAQVVGSIDQIDLLNNPGKVFICDGLPLSSQSIFESKASKYADERDLDLWIILSKFCNENRAIGRLELLPTWLDKYVRYDNPLPLPTAFQNMVNCDHPLEQLRIVLGMYPGVLSVNTFSVAISQKQKILEIACCLPSWFISRVEQMLCIAEDFSLDGIVENGVFIGCAPTPDSLAELCSRYE